MYSTPQLLVRIGRYLQSGIQPLLMAALLAVGSSLVASALPVVIAVTIDGRLRGSISNAQLCMIVTALAVSGWALNWGRQWLTAGLVGQTVRRLQIDATDAALAKDAAFFDRHSPGQVLSRVTGDTEGFASVLTLTLNFVSQLFLVILLGGLVFYIQIALGFLLVAIVPLLVSTTLLFRRVARTAATSTRRVMARITANVHESMAGIGVTKGFGQEDSTYREFDQLNRLSYQVYLRQGLIYSMILPVLTLLAGLGTVATLYVGGRLSQLGSLSTGEWYFAISALGALWVPLTQAASFWSLFQQGLAASERVFALIDDRDSSIRSGSEPVAALDGSIELRSVTFSYSATSKVFENLDLYIPAKQVVAIVGETGAGKSTLAKLISRSHEYDGGELLVDGRDVRSMMLADYRRQVGMVPQFPYLFNGTVAENIAYARPGAPRSDVMDVIRAIGADLWERIVPFDLDDRIDNSRRGVSVGQRQMIAVARVFLQQPSILVLDEPTASLDPATERAIQQALGRLMAGRTVLIIAHRLATVRRADRVLVLNEGAIVGDGTYQDLLKQSTHFAELHRNYYSHEAKMQPAMQAEMTRPMQI
ncbi:ABC transporter ATP-binding protein [Sphingomonas sp. HF-S4]|uniref:ABC transporter ATP-binding protein n=1 Tax=Sphingomonas agrestis TaxID=3080540 RepID=A0ABU3YCM9_9SPHN|nr:ABC transporter ATP-binding protein [Sphingomonas sp. HF-S4]MDV3458932.1 ABC transporter ATP-binding protein [Sphingomonas sp. HF-S4]